MHGVYIVALSTIITCIYNYSHSYILFGLVLIHVVSISVAITPSGSPMAGETYSLECSCSVNGTSDTPSYQWLVGPPDNRTLLNSDGPWTIYSNSTSSMLQFTTLRATDGGEYTCQVSVGGALAETTNTMEISRKYSNHAYFIMCMLYMAVGLTPFISILSITPTAHAVPPPTIVMVTHPVGAIHAGASLSLTCTVELSSSVDVPVTVNTVWTGPNMTSFSPTNSTPAVMENHTTYTSSVTVNTVRSGSYTCEATLSSSSTFITGNGTLNGSVDVIVGMFIYHSIQCSYSLLSSYNSARFVDPLPSPTTLLVSPTSPPTSITLIWEQPEGADAVNGYEINYSYQVIECARDGDTRPFPTVTVTLNNGSLRHYTITNSQYYTTPVEEDSQYTISITAFNSVGLSGPSNMAFTTTAEAGYEDSDSSY